MSYEKIARLVTALSLKTENHELAWNETEKEGTYETSFPNYSVRISRNEKLDYNENLMPIILLELTNQNGEIIEQIDDEDLRNLLQDPYPLMKNMYDTARRQAMGVEDALDAILNIIDPEVPF